MDFPAADQIQLAAGGVDMAHMVADGLDSQVLILSGGASTSINSSDFADTNFFVSGSMGSKNTATRGTSAFGGDLSVSGTIYASAGMYVKENFQAVPFTYQFQSGQGKGEFLTFSPGANDTLTAGKLYYLHTDGTWNETDANAAASGAGQMLGIGLGGPSQYVGVMTKGFFRVPAAYFNGTMASGSAIYVSEAATGEFDADAPAGSGDFVRVVGYSLAHDATTGDVFIHFNPDATYLEIS
jgi:hypothetical protein